jgi:hypothetical protein
MTEPEPFQTTRYRCKWCRRSWSAKKAAADHIARCWLNPENRSCKTCDNYEEMSSCDSGYHCGCPLIPESCRVGIEFEPHEDREGVVMLPLHCPQYTREEAA